MYEWRPKVVVFLLIACFGHAVARQDILQDRSVARLPGFRGSSASQQTGQQAGRAVLPSVMPVEEQVDPEQYIVGPNDVFQVSLMGTSELVSQVAVSAEGSLLLPGAGEIEVGGHSLAEAKKRILDELKKFYRVSQSSVNLFSPRQFIVNVLGAAKNPGPYVTTQTIRLDKVILLANTPQTFQQSEKMTIPVLSRRRIVLRRKGHDRIVDLEMFFAQGHTDQNPFLLEGDIVLVPPPNIDQASISVYGAVNNPLQFEYREYDSLRAMIKIAQGLTPNADISSVELTRLSTDARASTSRIIDLTDIIAGRSPDIPLQNRDRILVREKMDRRMDYKVHVRGEVKYPGMYPITPDSTRLTEIIRRAGGFTEMASLREAEIERKQLTPSGADVDLSREAMINLRMNDQLVTPEERAYYDLEALLRRGTVAVDFEQIFKQNDLSKDVYLRDGDIVFVPSSSRTVYVYGQVSRPGYVTFKEGADVRYYVGLAGGFGEEAESGRTRVIKGKTREWRDPSDTEIEPGDYIWVPKDVKYPLSYYLNLVSQAASFVSVVMSMTVIIIQLTRSN